jgi:hypothetical protein
MAGWPAAFEEAGKDMMRRQVRTWRDVARLKGAEVADQEGVKALFRLPMLMEEVMEEWKETTQYAGFKAEGMVTCRASPLPSRSADRRRYIDPEVPSTSQNTAVALLR